MSQHDSQSPQGSMPARRFRQLVWGNRWGRLLVVSVLIILAVAPFAVAWTVHRFTHSITDDAFVETHLVNIGPQEVSGHLTRFLVQEQDVVAAGQLLVEIDSVPYREQVELLQAKLGVAEAQREATQASLEVLRAQVPREIEVAQKALAAAQAEQARDDKTLQFTTEDVEKAIHEAESDVAAARARLGLAEKDHVRYATLFAKEAATQRQSQEATRTFDVTGAEVKSAEARLGRVLAGRKNEMRALESTVKPN